MPHKGLGQVRDKWKREYRVVAVQKLRLPYQSDTALLTLSALILLSLNFSSYIYLGMSNTQKCLSSLSRDKISPPPSTCTSIIHTISRDANIQKSLSNLLYKYNLSHFSKDMYIQYILHFSLHNQYSTYLDASPHNSHLHTQKQDLFTTSLTWYREQWG